jgi:hypothetical protein
MKKAFIYILACCAIISCRKDDSSVFEKSADERLNEALATYQAQLLGAENGWKAFVSPPSGGVYFFYFKFNNQNRVKMYSTFDSTSAVTPGESSYRLKGLQQPSLIFDTYSYLHVLADPNESTRNVMADVNGGPVGEGLQSDFEYYFDSTSTDTIYLVGRFNKTQAKLIRATKQEADAYDNKELGRSFLFSNINRYQNYFKRVIFGGVTYEMNVNQFQRTITFTWIDGTGAARSFTTTYYNSSTGIVLLNPLVNGSTTVSSFDNLTWNPNTMLLGFTVNGTTVTVNPANQPLRPDLGAPNRWWQQSVSTDNYWVSVSGFHINGVDDAYNLSSIPNFAYLLYWAKFSTFNSVTYDLLSPISGNSITNGGGFFPPVFTTDGRIILSRYVTLGTVSNQLLNSFAKMGDAGGYYLVQTSPISYDMVSASDSRVWISWFWLF